jgi:O-acetyl-ADP-ribose deacetylase (regulator of RNase III)
MKERIEIVKGDITKLQVDAIVNAANSSLLGGGGVDGAIHRAAGPQLVEECRLLGGCKTGQAKITGGYHLPARYVIHTVGPVWNGGGQGEPELLASCYRNSFALALKNNIKTLAFPAISCGIYGYPIEEAVEIALRETLDFLSGHNAIERVIFACFEADVYQAYLDAFARVND